MQQATLDDESRAVALGTHKHVLLGYVLDQRSHRSAIVSFQFARSMLFGFVFPVIALVFLPELSFLTWRTRYGLLVSETSSV